MALTEQSTGLGIEPPTPYVAMLLATRAPIAVAIGISESPQAFAPESVLGTNRECTLALRTSEENIGVQQEDLNEFVISDRYKKATKASLELGYDIGDPTAFTVQDVAGLEFIGAIRADAKQAEIPVYVAMMMIPQGAVLLNCFAPRDAGEGAISDFRAIRDSIKLPR